MPSPVTPVAGPGGRPFGPQESRQVHWLAAIGLGLLAAIIGGIAWGAILAVTEYIFFWGAIIIGLFVAWAVQKGAKRASGGLIVLAGLLTIFSIFFGQIVAIAIVIAPFGGSPLDAILFYPEFVALAPVDVAISYIFAMVGVAAAAWYLYQQLRSERMYRALPPPLFGYPSPAAPGGSATGVERPTLRATERSATRVAVEVRLPSPEAHVVAASYNTWNGMAEVLVDGRPFAKSRVWGMSKTIEVPLGSAVTQHLRFVFRGAVKPMIDVFLNGAPLGTV